VRIAVSETKTYEGGCHCGRVRYRIEADLSQVYACNCSMCGRMGWRLAFVPAASFTLLSGEGEQTDYQFHNKHIHHLFCRTCGVRSFSHGPGKDGESYSVNARCLDGVGVDADKLPTQHFDGAKL
jgi:hypothetical protein